MELRYATMEDLMGVYNLICSLEGKEMPIGEFKYIYCHNLCNDKIHYFVIEEGHRGKGLGSRLIAQFKEISQENKCELIEVCCNRKREETHAFYEGCGFSRSHYKFTLK